MRLAIWPDGRERSLYRIRTCTPIIIQRRPCPDQTLAVVRPSLLVLHAGIGPAGDVESATRDTEGSVAYGVGVAATVGDEFGFDSEVGFQGAAGEEGEGRGEEVG